MQLQGGLRYRWPVCCRKTVAFCELETEEGGCNGVGATKCYDKKREEQNKKNKEGRPSLSPSLHVRSEADVQIDALRAV